MHGERLAWVLGTYTTSARAYMHRPYSMQDKAGHLTIVQLSGLKPAMLVSSVQAVVHVACYATAPRVCTLVLSINPRRTCTARVTVVVLCVCLSASPHSNLQTGASRCQTEGTSGTSGLHALILKGIFPKNAWLGN